MIEVRRPVTSCNLCTYVRSRCNLLHRYSGSEDALEWGILRADIAAVDHDQSAARAEHTLIHLFGFINGLVIQPEARRGHTLDALQSPGATTADMYNRALQDKSLSLRLMRALCDGSDIHVWNPQERAMGVTELASRSYG